MCLILQKLFNFVSRMEAQVVYIALGSNMPIAPRILEWTRRKLRAVLGKGCRFSQAVWTEPIDYPYPYPFLNQVGVFVSERTPAVLTSLFKQIEANMRKRKSAVREGSVILDIDLLTYGDRVLRTDDWLRTYVQAGVKELAGYMPLLHEGFTLR